VCHATFTGFTYFDEHRVGGECWGFPQDPNITPAWNRLEEVDGVWSSPEGHLNREALNGRAQNARKGRKSAVADTDVAKRDVSPEAISAWVKKNVADSYRLSGLIE
jgi:hypothetical protein